MAKVGIIGGSGYTGAELLRLLSMHPELDVVHVTGDTAAGSQVADLYPSLAAGYGGLAFTAYDPADVAGLDLVFLALPHGHSQRIVPELVGTVGHLVDLAADFRLKDPALYPQWYGEAHEAPQLLGDFAYGLPELFRDQLRGAPLVAVPGCYPTAASLALAPLVRAGLVAREGIIVDAASGVSGAGKGKFPFCGTDEDFVAYGLLDHRHTPEIEINTGATVLFTPHLAPMNRGILATCYARPTAATSTEEVLACLADAYDAEPFVVVSARPPSTKATLGSNAAHLTARADPRTGYVLALGAIDNLVKGASGQAIQCANLALGLDETLGLPTTGMAA
ncbi:MAG TPA: N-acetyl-gamma-glutamyl-phosphate reductase [Acidimicrobiales bacterium]|nr:N-acetyl-gamma-glutamyl-phosphate reductase [Acidimicrobiales bacterium]